MAKKHKPVPAKKSAKSVQKPAPAAKKAPHGKPVAPPRPPPAAKPAPPAKIPTADAKSAKSDELKRRILERKSSKPIAFSLDEVREIAKKNEKKAAMLAGAAADKPAKEASKAELDRKGSSHPPISNYVKAASLADILGFNPNKAQSPQAEDENAGAVPEKFRRYYRLLVELHNHVLDSLGHHSEETLKRSAKEDAGDLSGYGQHMADAGTDTFDRDFALSLVSSEQEALSEVEAAIRRIHDGTYGICELTGKPIGKDRLLVVPFTRYSAEAQKELEKTTHHSIQRAGIFADTTAEEGGKIVEEEPED
jgi:RNA polymerase-binding transcription factor DksA